MFIADNFSEPFNDEIFATIFGSFRSAVTMLKATSSNLEQ
jgi:hypothetical protein